MKTSWAMAMWSRRARGPQAGDLRRWPGSWIRTDGRRCDPRLASVGELHLVPLVLLGPRLAHHGELGAFRRGAEDAVADAGSLAEIRRLTPHVDDGWRRAGAGGVRPDARRRRHRPGAGAHDECRARLILLGIGYGERLHRRHHPVVAVRGIGGQRDGALDLVGALDEHQLARGQLGQRLIVEENGAGLAHAYLVVL